MHSRLTTVHSRLTTKHSRLTTVHSRLTTMHSRLIIMHSRLTIVVTTNNNAFTTNNNALTTNNNAFTTNNIAFRTSFPFYVIFGLDSSILIHARSQSASSLNWQTISKFPCFLEAQAKRLGLWSSHLKSGLEHWTVYFLWDSRTLFTWWTNWTGQS